MDRRFQSSAGPDARHADGGAQSAAQDPALRSFAVEDDFIYARAWRELPGIAHGFSTRHSERRRFFRRAAGGGKFIGPVFARQVHSDIVWPLKEAPQTAPAGDALVTATPGLALSVKTADCFPILLFDPGIPAAGVIHAGWRGTVKRIAEKAVGVMRAWYGADPGRMYAAIGPGIHSCCYEVGEEVIVAFRSQFTCADELFRNPRGQNPADIRLPRQVLTAGRPPLRDLAPGRACLNLEEANRRQLLAAGLKAENIAAGAPCTACRNDLLYSYRREGAAAGRLYAFVLLS
jgi:hypothetical protein